MFDLKSRMSQDRLSNPSMLTFREIMTNGLFESDTRVVLKKLTSSLAMLSLRKIRFCIRETISGSIR